MGYQETKPNIMPRRSFLQTAAWAGAGGALAASIWDDEAFAVENVNRNSSPSELKITDLRVAVVHRAPMTCPLIRIDTNQGLVGWGEVRDGGAKEYALFLKSRLLGENPCNVERLFKRIKQFGHHGRQAGGVCGVEMALWDLAGKAFNTPVYQMLGGRYRDSIRCYCDTTWSRDPKEYAQRMKERVEEGFTYLKMDLGASMLRNVEGAMTRPLGDMPGNHVMHPFTGIELTDKGIGILADFVAAIRDEIGYEIPLAADHFGHIGLNSCIRLGKALEPYQMAWLEDMVPWQYTDMWRQITEAIDVPTLTGEDIYLKEEFIKLCDAHAVDMIHPDLASSGGILETKRIGDYAQEKGIPMAMHFAGTPVSCMANVHCAAATENFLCLENHSVDVEWWDDMVDGIDKPIIQKGFIPVPEGPGLGVEVNEEVVKEHLRPGEGLFEPTDEWNEMRSWDRLWS